MTRVLTRLGSLHITFPAMALLAAAVAAGHALDAAPRWLPAVPLAVLAVNLLAAIGTHPRLRLQLPLLAFHLCLLAALLLSLAAMVTKLEARVEVLEGADVDPSAIEVVERGALHPSGALAGLRFAQRGFRIDYAPGLVRGETRATVSVPDGAGGLATVTFGDTRPLVQGGLRVYTTSNKGYAAVVTWQARGAPAVHGAIHFPSYPLQDWNQRRVWRTPSGAAVELELGTSVAVADDAWTFESARVARDLPLRVRDARGGHWLAPGEWLDVEGGRLHYEYVATWMGYRITYDPTLPWLIASGIAGALALGWHFLLALPRPDRAHARVEQVGAAGA